MDLKVIGCHGGETPKHRTSAFILDDRVAIDAGSLTSGMELKAQCALEACLVSHAHLDHIRDLATIADNRTQTRSPPLTIAGTKQTIEILKKHFFNGLLWPDFTKIPNASHPAIKYLVLVNETAGDDWLDPRWFRLGASSLLNDLLMQRTKMATGRYSGPDYFTLD